MENGITLMLAPKSAKGSSGMISELIVKSVNFLAYIEVMRWAVKEQVKEGGKNFCIKIQKRVDVVDRERSRVLPGVKLSFRIVKKGEHFSIATPGHDKKRGSLSEQLQKKKRKRGSSQPSLQDPTYDQLMTKITTLKGTVSTLTKTVLSLQGTIGTLESRFLTLEGDARVSTLTETVSSLQGTIDTLESRLLAL
nr:hypothetical protein [Tanacetum cinerariifolium]